MSSLGNTQAYYNGYVSACRNIFLTSSVGIAMFGYSHTFKISTSTTLVMVASKAIFLFAFLYGLITVIGLNRYIKSIEESNEKQPETVQLDIWRRNMYLVCGYLLIILVLFFLKLRRFVSII